MLLVLPSLAVWLAFADLNGWPQNDDPYYGKPVQWLVEEGQFQLAAQKGELSASTVAHVVFGAASSLLFGFSYRSLFLACIVQQWIGASAVYGVGRVSGLGRSVSLVLGFTFALQPLIFGNSFTFMTDTPAAAWVAVACLASSLAFTRGSRIWLLTCSLAVAWAFWIRQTHLLVLGAPLATLISLKLVRRTSIPLVSGALTLLAPAVVALGVMESGWIVESTSDRMHTVVSDVEGVSRIRQMIVAAYGMCLNVGLFGLPLSVLLIDAIVSRRSTMDATRRRICGAAAVAAVLLLAAPFVMTQGGACVTNSTGNYIQNGHAGPVFMADMDEPGRWGTLDGVEWPLTVWQILTVAVILVDGLIVWWVASLMTTWWRAWQRRATQHTEPSAGPQQDVSASGESDEQEFELVHLAVGSFAMSAVGAVVLLLIVDPLLDRYLLLFFAPILCAMGMILRISGWRPSRMCMSCTSVLLIGLYAFNVVYTHDLLTWNDVRWRQVQSWRNAGLQPSEFDGGRDVNAWLRLAEDRNSHDRPGDTSPWWSGSARLCITVGPRHGWEEHAMLKWHSWATGRDHHLYVLRKLPRKSGSTAAEASSENL
ncbi:MAG TPA: hypothetical protein EYG03_31285 [Planctomycetes bacterium]|nr:hypothetical protein [Fuerstiella sp.]HIK96449.1 hypothetical protein [Planctomycetota bacterium]